MWPKFEDNNQAGFAKQKRDAFSLLELLVVLVILIATSLILIPTFTNLQVTAGDGEKKNPEAVATKATMQTVRDAIIGSNGVLENLSHQPSALPRKMEELVTKEAPRQLVELSPELERFDPVRKIGWRGPYVLPTGKSNDGRPTVFDGWGNEFVLQADFDDDGLVNSEESKYIRIVSAGPNGKVDTPADPTNMKPGKEISSELTLGECGDDIVMFLRYPDNRK